MAEDQFVITISGVDPQDVEDLEDASRHLRDELQEIDGFEVTEAPGGPPQEGTRSGLEFALATLVASFYGVYAAKRAKEAEVVIREKIIPNVARILHDWLHRNKGKRAKIRFPDGTEVELTNLSEQGTRKILERLSRGNGPDAG